ncbi:hypothetical protein [Mucilaginibacter polytrichastri]|uniref:DUF4199 domain-containing protein n=1 Tax=Mucilaginibacter polytrichastri TaxID=1302689 RepID=A0A1Q6A4P0_9SPHI|nr:hypothetical protein [Mucilaginibacter polytrichastri]OKS88984.1 hypothetical protein RG47T_4462 [Mucilaginibacter polytrichastri]SFS95106.1 hypothetical protein SAMN04487890_10723 [Mucilaginibacter polytrichastri]
MRSDIKNAVMYGLFIGVLSIIWLVIVQKIWPGVKDNTLSLYEYLSGLIPLIGLFLGINAYRASLNGEMGFIQALVQCFKILIIGGGIAVLAGALYIGTITETGTASDLSGRLFAALLIGIILAFGVSLLLMTKSRKID